MGIVDDVQNRFRQDTDTYPVSETMHQEEDRIGTFPPETLRELLKEHPDACRVFKMISGVGYEDPSKNADDTSRTEHAGRVEIDPMEIIDDLLSESCTCKVRLSTSDPQLVTIVDNNDTKQIEIYDTVARLTPPTTDS